MPLLNYIHYNNNHIKRESMDQRIIEMGYYWHGYSKDIENLIKSCDICHSENIAKKYPITLKLFKLMVQTNVINAIYGVSQIF